MPASTSSRAAVVVIADQELRMWRVAVVAFDQRGYSVEELRGRRLGEVVPADSLAVFEASGRAAVGGQP
jgi:hypothetical protein